MKFAKGIATQCYSIEALAVGPRNYNVIINGYRNH